MNHDKPQRLDDLSSFSRHIILGSLVRLIMCLASFNRFILTYFIVINSFCFVTPAQAIDLTLGVENVINEFKEYYQAELGPDRREEIKIFQENLLKYLIEASYSNDAHKIKIYKEASVYFNRIYPVLLLNIYREKRGDNRFIPIRQAPQWTLKDEIEFLNKEALSLSPPRFSIDLLKGLKILAPFYQRLPLKMKDKIAGKYSQFSRSAISERIDIYPEFEEIEDLLKKGQTDDLRIIKFINLVERKLKRHVDSIRHIGTEITKSGQIDQKNISMRLVVNFMDFYFNNLSDDVIKTILSELVTSGPKMTEETILQIIFKNTGPGLGKVLQQIGKEKSIGNKFSKVMEVLESSGKPVPLHLVERIVKRDLGGFEIKWISNHPLGTGTVAQVNKALLVWENREKEIALRFLKPGVELRGSEDIFILRKYVQNNEQALKAEGLDNLKMMNTLIDSVERFLAEETELELSVERQKRGDEVYSRAIKISPDSTFNHLEMKVPAVYLPPNGQSHLHIQEFVTGGQKFSDLTDVNARHIVAQEMLRMWFEEALFKSGFLNADLHQGNFRVVLLEEGAKIKILLYDFGLSTTLTKKDQRAFILIGAGAELKSASTIANGLMEAMGSGDKLLRKKLLESIENELRINPNNAAEDWITWCLQKNYFISEKLGAFARGSLLLKQLPEVIGEVEMFDHVMRDIAKKNLVRMIADRKYDFPITKGDLAKIASEKVKKTCVDFLKLFFK